jgi:hypothetical protein
VFWVGSRHLDRGLEGATEKGAADILRGYPLDEITARPREYGDMIMPGGLLPGVVES